MRLLATCVLLMTIIVSPVLAEEKKETKTVLSLNVGVAAIDYRSEFHASQPNIFALIFEGGGSLEMPKAVIRSNYAWTVGGMAINAKGEYQIFNPGPIRIKLGLDYLHLSKKESFLNVNTVKLIGNTRSNLLAVSIRTEFSFRRAILGFVVSRGMLEKRQTVDILIDGQSVNDGQLEIREDMRPVVGGGGFISLRMPCRLDLNVNARYFSVSDNQQRFLPINFYSVNAEIGRIISKHVTLIFKVEVANSDVIELGQTAMGGHIRFKF